MKFDITKIANVILYMLEEEVQQLNDRKLIVLLFLMDFNHNKACGTKIFNEEYEKGARGPEALILGDIFDIIANDVDLDEEDERIFLITEMLDFLDIEILHKEKFNELEFIKMEEEFDEELFDKEEMKTIKKVVSEFKEASPRNAANATFKIDEVRETAKGEIIL